MIVKNSMGDELYTPPELYKLVKNRALELFPEYTDSDVVRPFYPGGDFENFNYPDHCIVIDNPPFSIVSYIQNIYNYRNIKYVLFNDARFLRKSQTVGCVLLHSAGIKYINCTKKCVCLGLVTNLFDGLYLDGILYNNIRKLDCCVDNRGVGPMKEDHTFVYNTTLLEKYVIPGVSYMIESYIPSYKRGKSSVESEFYISEQEKNKLQRIKYNYICWRDHKDGYSDTEYLAKQRCLSHCNVYNSVSLP